jgi:hypothetical protein
MSEIEWLRHLLLENSATTALMPESMPPMPRPVNTRQMESWTGLAAVVAPSMPAAITIKDPSSAGRRQRRPGRARCPQQRYERHGRQVTRNR